MVIAKELLQRTGLCIEPLSHDEFEKLHAIENGINDLWYQNDADVYHSAVVEAIRGGVSPYHIRESTTNHLSGVLWANTAFEKDGASPHDNFNRCVMLLKLSPEQTEEVIRTTISHTVVTEYPTYRYPSCRPILDFATKQGFSLEKQRAAVLDGVAFLLLHSQKGDAETNERRITGVLTETGLTENDIFSHPLLQHAARSYFAQDWNSNIIDISTAEYHREHYGFRLLSPDSKKILAIREILLTFPSDDKTVSEILQAFDITDLKDILGHSLEGHIEWINPNLAEMLFGWETETLAEYLEFARQNTAYVWRVGNKDRLQPPHTESQLAGPHPFAVLEIPPQTPKEQIRRERLKRLFAKARMLERVFTPFIENNIPTDNPWQHVRLQEKGELEPEEKILGEFLIERQARVRDAYNLLKSRDHGDYEQMGRIMYDWMCKQADKPIRSPHFAPDIAFHPLGIIVWVDEGIPSHNDYEYIHGYASGGFFRNEQKVYEGNQATMAVPVIVLWTNLMMNRTSYSLSHEIGHGVAYAYMDFLKQYGRQTRWGEAAGLSDERKKEIGKVLLAKYDSFEWPPGDPSFPAYQKRRLATLRQSSEWNIIQQNMISAAKNEIISALFDGDLRSKHGSMRGSEGLYGYIKDFHIGTRNKLGIAVWEDYQMILEREMGTVRLLEEAYRVPGFEERRRLLKWTLMQLPMDEWHNEFYRLGLGEEAELLVNIYRLCDADPFVHKENTPIPSHIRQMNRQLSQEEQKYLYDDYWRLYFQLKRNPSFLYTNQLRAFIKYIETNRLSNFG